MWIDPVREVSVILLTNRVVFGKENRKLSALRPRIHDAVWEEIAGEERHLIAACGVGMASLAGMLKEKGCRVTDPTRTSTRR